MQGMVTLTRFPSPKDDIEQLKVRALQSPSCAESPGAACGALLTAAIMVAHDAKLSPVELQGMFATMVPVVYALEEFLAKGSQ